VAYGEYAMKKSSVVERHRRLKGRRDVQDDPRSGQPKTERTDANVDGVRTLVSSHRRLSVRLIAEEPSMNREQCDRLLLRNWEWGKFLQRWCLAS
jgi:hypothetical protein